MNDYKAKLELEHEEILSLRNALRIVKGVYENMPNTSAYTLSQNSEYVNTCKLLEMVNNHL